MYNDNIKLDEIVNDESFKNVMDIAFLQYALSVIKERALPDIRDGLKPVQRRLIYAMFLLGLTENSPHMKSAEIGGVVSGKFHPHGPGNVYGALCNLVPDWGIRYPLIDGQGNFGSLDNDPAAADRYTEARLKKVAEWIVKYLNKDSVNMVPNYTERDVEPEVMTGLFPNLLVNGASGIAVGMSTSMPPHNLVEVIDAIIAFFKDPSLTARDIHEKYIKGPDYPLGGYIIKTPNMAKYYTDGRGNFIVRAKHHVEENKKTGAKSIVFTSIPPDVNKEKLIDKLSEAHFDGKLPKVIRIRDDSDLDNLVRIVVELDKTAVPDLVLKDLYHNSNLQVTVSYGSVGLHKGTPHLFNLRGLIRLYVEHQREVATRRFNYDLKNEEKALNILYGKRKIIDHIKELVAMIYDFDEENEALTLEDKIKLRFGLNDEQVASILTMQIQSIKRMNREKLHKDIANTEERIIWLKNTLADPVLIDAEIIADLEEIKKNHGDPRRTEIIEVDDVKKVLKLKDLVNEPISNEPMAVVLTTKGTFKSMPYATFLEMSKKSIFRDQKDNFKQVVKCTPADTLLVFVEPNFYVRCSFADLFDESSKNAEFKQKLGTSKILAIVKQEPESNKEIVIVTKYGQIIKTNMKYFNARHKRFDNFMVFEKANDTVAAIRVTKPVITDDEEKKNVITIATKNRIIHRFNEDAFTATNTGGRGVPCIRTMENGDEIVSFDISNKADDENKMLILLTNKGVKKVKLSDFRVTRRVADGINCFNPKKTDIEVKEIVIHPSEATTELFGEGFLVYINGKHEISRKEINMIPTSSRYDPPSTSIPDIENIRFII